MSVTSPSACSATRCCAPPRRRSSTSTRSCAGWSRDLTDTMLDAPGAGLAAPQIGVGLRVFTWYVDGELGHLVNPDARPRPRRSRTAPEGCLSLPGLHLRLPAGAAAWSPAASNMYGEPVTIEGTELLARAIQHETDHLDGILFVDRLDPEQPARRR